MRIILFALMTLVPLLYSVAIFAQMTSVDQIFFGSRGADNSCGINGRLVKKSEVQGIPNFCDKVESQWAIWKLDGEDGTFGSLMGWGYYCQIKSNVSADVHSVCTMKDIPPDDTGYFFSKPSFRGKNNWNGKAVVSHKGDEVPITSVNSMTLGRSVQVTAYSEENFKGKSKVYVTSVAQTSFTVKSYQVQNRSKPQPEVTSKAVTASFVSNASGNPCMMVGFVRGKPHVICKSSGSKPVVIGSSSEFDETKKEDVGIMLVDGDTRENGKVEVQSSKGGDIELGKKELPADMTVTQSGNDLQFGYYPKGKPEPEVTGQDVTATFASSVEGNPCMMVGFVSGRSQVVCKSGGQTPVPIGNSDDFKPGEEQTINFVLIPNNESISGSAVVTFDEQGSMSLISEAMSKGIGLEWAENNLGFSYNPVTQPGPQPGPKPEPDSSITVSLSSTEQGMCLGLVVSGVSITDQCSGEEPKKLIDIKKDGRVFVQSVQMYLYQKATSTVAGRGNVFIVFDGKGNSRVDHDASVFPERVSVSQSGNELKFKYTK